MDNVRTINVHFSLRRSNLHLTCLSFLFHFLSAVIFKATVFIL
jgi:hypothetical protein